MKLCWAHQVMSQHGESHRETETYSQSVKGRIHDSVLAGKRLGAAEDDAVHDDKRDEEAQCLVHVRSIGLHGELEDGIPDDDARDLVKMGVEEAAVVVQDRRAGPDPVAVQGLPVGGAHVHDDVVGGRRRGPPDPEEGGTEDG